MKKAMKWGGICAIIGAVIGIILSIEDNLLTWPPLGLTPYGMLYLLASVAVPALLLFVLGFAAGLVAEKGKSAQSKR